jgi:fused-like protein
MLLSGKNKIVHCYYYYHYYYYWVQILRKLKHENIIEMLDSFESPQEFCVVTEFAQVRYPSQQANIYLLWIFTFQTRQELRFVDVQGELFEVLEDDKSLPEEQVQAIAKQLVIP